MKSLKTLPIELFWLLIPLFTDPSEQSLTRGFFGCQDRHPSPIHKGLRSARAAQTCGSRISSLLNQPVVTRLVNRRRDFQKFPTLPPPAGRATGVGSIFGRAGSPFSRTWSARNIVLTPVGRMAWAAELRDWGRGNFRASGESLQPNLVGQKHCPDPRGANGMGGGTARQGQGSFRASGESLQPNMVGPKHCPDPHGANGMGGGTARQGSGQFSGERRVPLAANGRPETLS
jgi:hypothetical protein